MANPSAVPVLGKVTPVKTPDGATIHMVPTETGHILVGENGIGGEMTVVVSGPTTSAVTVGEVFDAAKKGVGALNNLLNGGSKCGEITIQAEKVLICSNCTVTM